MVSSAQGNNISKRRNIISKLGHGKGERKATNNRETKESCNSKANKLVLRLDLQIEAKK